jgi:hypothetical protein
MAINSLREVIVAGLEQTFPAKMGLQNLVFGKAVKTTYDVETVQVDMYDGTRGTAGYTKRGAKGQTVGLEGWRTEVYTPPLIDENFVLTAQDLKVRGFGESNINMPQGKKFQDIVNRQISRLKNRKQRAYNEQIVSLLKTGKITVTEKDDKGNTVASREINFKMPSAHIYTVGTPWNNSNAKILFDMQAADKLIIKASGLTPDRAIVGSTTIQDMIANAEIRALLDNRRINFGEFVKENRADGLTYWGVLDGKEIYTFTDFDDAGNDLIPASAYIPFSSQAELDIVFGSIDAMVNGEPAIVEGEEVIVDTVDVEAVSKKWAFKSAGLFCLTQAGAFAHITTR